VAVAVADVMAVAAAVAVVDALADVAIIVACLLSFCFSASMAMVTMVSSDAASFPKPPVVSTGGSF